jgi:transglutaminase-like putative cysteine protease
VLSQRGTSSTGSRTLFSNYLARLVFPDRTQEFKVTVDLVAEMSVYNPFDFFLEPEAERYPFRYAPELEHDLLPYLIKGDLTPRFKAFVASIPRDEVRTIDFPGGAEPAPAAGYHLFDTLGARGADAGGDAGPWLRFLP